MGSNPTHTIKYKLDTLSRQINFYLLFVLGEWNMDVLDSYIIISGLLIVANRSAEREYVTRYKNSVKKYDKAQHVIYLKNNKQLVVVTLHSSLGLLDGWNIFFNHIEIYIHHSKDFIDLSKWIVDNNWFIQDRLTTEDEIDI